MKKIKLFLPVLMALVVIFSLSLFACRKTDKETLRSIEITAGPDRTLFIAGEEFNSTGLEVTAKFTKSKKVLTEEEYVLDASAYDSTKEGTYEIKVSYTYKAKTAEASYSVTVKETVYGGLEVSLAEGYEATWPYLLFEYVIVNEVDQEGNIIEEPLKPDEYTIKIYSGNNEVEHNGEYAVLSSGIKYQIWAFKDSSVITDFVMSNFVFLTVS